MPKLYAYIRVSTLDQKQRGWSLDVQWRRAQLYAELLASRPGLEDLVLAETIDDAGQSAYRKPLIERKRGSELNSKLQVGDHVAFVRMDRAFRNLRDFVQTKHLWDMRNITIHFIDQMIDLSTANGRLAGNIMAAVAQWESDVKSERMLETFDRLRAENRITTGTVAAGFKKIGKPGQKRIVPDRDKWPIIRLIAFLRHRGMTWKEISDRVEVLLAKRENRKPYGRIDWGVGEKRAWGWQLCKMAYERRKRLNLR